MDAGRTLESGIITYGGEELAATRRFQKAATGGIPACVLITPGGTAGPANNLASICHAELAMKHGGVKEDVNLVPRGLSLHTLSCRNTSRTTA